MGTVTRLVRDGWKDKAQNLWERIAGGQVVGSVVRFPDGSFRWTAKLRHATLTDYTHDREEAFMAVDRVVGSGGLYSR